MEQSYYWGQSKKAKVEINNLPPRIIWLCQDWTLAFVHRYVASKYLHMLAPLNEEDAQVSYEDVYDLTDYDQTPSPEMLDA